jgi:hypothetical protein
MFCPICKAEYMPGFTKCADCAVDLVDKLIEEPVNKGDADKEFIEMLRTNSLTDIAQIKGVLDSNGVRYFITGDLMRSIRPVDEAILMVLEDDVEKAGRLLKKIKLNYFKFIFTKNVLENKK